MSNELIVIEVNGMSKFNPKDSLLNIGMVYLLRNHLFQNHTLTYSDLTGELFLTMGTHFVLDKNNTELRDEVIGMTTGNK